MPAKCAQGRLLTLSNRPDNHYFIGSKMLATPTRCSIIQIRIGRLT